MMHAGTGIDEDGVLTGQKVHVGIEVHTSETSDSHQLSIKYVRI